VSPRASGAIPGLLRRGSPVVAAVEIVHRRRTYAPEGHPGVVVGLDDRWATCHFSGGFCSPIRPDCLALDLTDPTGMDHGARFVAEEILDPSWGTVEGVICHMSWRGYLELHIWTTRLRGRPLSVNVGSRFSTLLPGTFEAFEQRNRTHGWGEFAIGTPSEPTDPAEALALAIAHVAGSGS
jgi:hypothetical protein